MIIFVYTMSLEHPDICYDLCCWDKGINEYDENTFEVLKHNIQNISKDFFWFPTIDITTNPIEVLRDYKNCDPEYENNDNDMMYVLCVCENECIASRLKNRLIKCFGREKYQLRKLQDSNNKNETLNFVYILVDGKIPQETILKLTKYLEENDKKVSQEIILDLSKYIENYVKKIIPRNY